MTVRPCIPADAEALRVLCLTATRLRKRTEVERLVITLSRCQYYLDCEPGHSFAAEGEHGELAAAVLCAPNCVDYQRRFQERFLPRCAPYGLSAAAEARHVGLLHQTVAGYYPAHCLFHLPDSQVNETFPLLLAALAGHLEALECRGVCTFTEKKSPLPPLLTAAGFEPLRRQNGVLIWGKELF
ncbi:MAG: hypothetical protein LBJ11_04940 [Oscillospiraceae bacterium]|jgi:hypothetical protein|nr:hypothetical protein [Oscillospiraceae bacterium]